MVGNHPEEQKQREDASEWTHLANQELHIHDVAVAHAHVVEELRAADAVGDVGRRLTGVGQPGQGQVWVAARVGHQRVLHIQLHADACVSSCTQFRESRLQRWRFLLAVMSRLLLLGICQIRLRESGICIDGYLEAQGGTSSGPIPLDKYCR